MWRGLCPGGTTALPVFKMSPTKKKASLNCVNMQVKGPGKMSEEERHEVEEKVADALEEKFEQHDKVAKLHAPEIDEDIEPKAMEESSQDEGDDCSKMETAGQRSAMAWGGMGVWAWRATVASKVPWWASR